MNGLILRNLTGVSSLLPAFRALSVTAPRQLKEIVTSVDEKKQEITIVAKSIPSPHDPYLIETYKKCKSEGLPFCPECTLGLDIRHTDVLILSQYVTKEGLMLPRRITGLCKKQQRRIGNMVTMAQKAGLMINLTPPGSRKDPRKRRGVKQHLSYYDEKTIKCNHFRTF